MAVSTKVAPAPPYSGGTCRPGSFQLVAQALPQRGVVASGSAYLRERGGI